MKTTLYLPALRVVFALILIVGLSNKVQALTLTSSYSEDGNGSYTAGPNIGFLAPDPGPGGQSSALTYIEPYGNITGGDVYIVDPHGSSDLVRFNQFGIVFYSLPGGGQLADTGFPTDRYANIVTITENELGATIYTAPAGSGLPGSNLFFDTTYYFYSDAETVPDAGTSALLLGLGLLGLVCVYRTLGWQQRMLQQQAAADS